MLCGCHQDPPDENLARVAKDWCRTIRASQILPIYPLSEDIQPGDIYVVQTPIATEKDTFDKKGFLPLEQHVKRLQPEGYETFYAQSCPRAWRFPANTPSTRPWESYPRAAFPSYSFTIDRSLNGKVALPVHGVAVALDLLGTDNATGQLTINDAYTYGIDRASLLQQLRDWASSRAGKDLLREFEPHDFYVDRKGQIQTNSSVNFLRVVTRVYLAKSIGISLASGAGASATATAEYTRTIDQLNTGLQHATTEPSSNGQSSIVVTAISERAVSLVQTFTVPLVVGYIAIDFPIEEDGELGDRPFLTWNRLASGREELKEQWTYEKSCSTMLCRVRGDADDPAVVERISLLSTAEGKYKHTLQGYRLFFASGDHPDPSEIQRELGSSQSIYDMRLMALSYDKLAERAPSTDAATKEQQFQKAEKYYSDAEALAAESLPDDPPLLDAVELRRRIRAGIAGIHLSLGRLAGDPNSSAKSKQLLETADSEYRTLRESGVLIEPYLNGAGALSLLGKYDDASRVLASLRCDKTISADDKTTACRCAMDLTLMEELKPLAVHVNDLHVQWEDYVRTVFDDNCPPDSIRNFKGELSGTVSSVSEEGTSIVLRVEQVKAAKDSRASNPQQLIGSPVLLSCQWVESNGTLNPDPALKREIQKRRSGDSITTTVDGGIPMRLTVVGIKVN
jgi:hypothetical protein